MNHNVFGRKLSRSKNERRRLFANLIRSLILHGKIVTTEAKAKAIKGAVDKCITMAKKGTGAAYKNVLADVIDAKAAKQLMKDAKDRFAGRTSGYTRTVKLGRRSGDATEEVMMSFVDEVIASEVVTPPAKKVVKEEKVAEVKPVAPKAKKAKKVKSEEK